MCKFKIGDRVRRIGVTGGGTAFGGMRIGECATVSYVRSDGNLELKEFRGFIHHHVSFELVTDPDQCKFKPGSNYKTRNGKEAVVYAVYPEYGTIHGAIRYPNAMVSEVWTLSGKSVRSVQHYDLVPNTETVYVNLYVEKGVVRVRQYKTEKCAKAAAGANCVEVAKPVTYELV